MPVGLAAVSRSSTEIFFDRVVGLMGLYGIDSVFVSGITEDGAVVGFLAGAEDCGPAEKARLAAVMLATAERSLKQVPGMEAELEAARARVNAAPETKVSSDGDGSGGPGSGDESVSST